MARKPLRSQLNQIRAWVRQGRTDAWIAHQLDIPASELREFRRRHELAPEEETGDVELRDEIEAEIEATLDAEEERRTKRKRKRSSTRTRRTEDEERRPRLKARLRTPRAQATGRPPAGAAGAAGAAAAAAGGGARAGNAMQGTFDHGAEEGFGLWLDPAVEDDPVYTEHWAGHRPVEVTIEPDRIVIRRA